MVANIGELKIRAAAENERWRQRRQLPLPGDVTPLAQASLSSAAHGDNPTIACFNHLSRHFTSPPASILSGTRDARGDEDPASPTMINAFLVFNGQGQPRLTKFYTQLAS